MQVRDWAVVCRDVAAVMVVAVVIMRLPRDAEAQSNLPKCITNQTANWTNCFGAAKLIWGDYYQGEWRDGKPHGYGVFTSGGGADGRSVGLSISGEWRYGKLNGLGTEYRDGKIVRRGIWANDEFVGPPPQVGVGSSIPLIKESGTFKVSVVINGVIPLHFMVDSGAADVSIPADVVGTLIRTGTLTDNDFVGEQIYRLADGSRIKSKTFRIRQLKVGDRVVENVLGSIADVNGSLLLGQSFLSRFKKVSFDYGQGVLVLE
jgi:gag-polyprotein putative aspartyl protease/MORN repeat